MRGDIRSTAKEMLSAGLLCFGAGSLYGWSGLSGAVRDRFSVGATEIGEVFSLSILAFTAAALIGPRLSARFRGLRGAAVAGGFGAMATVLAMSASGYGMFLLCFSFGLGMTSGAIYVFSVEIAAESRHPGAVTPLMVASFGLGGVVFGPLMRILVGTGLDLAALWPATATLALGAATGLILGKTPVQARAVEQAPVAAPAPPSHYLTFLLWMVFTFGSMAGLMCLGLAVPVLSDRGASLAEQSFGLTTLALANTVGRLAVSPLQFAVPPVNVVALAAILSGLGVLSLLVFSGATTGVLALTLIAAGYGLMAAGMPVLTRVLILPGQFRQIFPIVFTGWGAAGLLSPRLSGTIRDATGSFDLALILCLSACFVSLGFSFLISRRFGQRSGYPS